MMESKLCVNYDGIFLGQILQESNEGRRPGIKIKIKIKIKSYINC